jgi:uncharacterized protein (TIGR01777 family)
MKLITPPRRIVLPGGSGHVGRLLARHFHEQGDDVTVLSRSVQSEPWRVLQWDGRTPGEWTEAVDGADVVINLAGRSVNCRYTAANRREIMASRVDSTQVLGQAIAQAAHPPEVWLNASTATIYRHALDRTMSEAEPPGELPGSEKNAPSTWRFSIDVATAWEQTFYEATAPHTRKVALRSAMTMSPDRDGIFDTLRKLVSLGLGGRAGSGKQFISWIHEADFVNAIEFLIANNNLEGSINACSPSPLPNREFMAIFRRAYGVPLGLPASRWMLELGAVFMRTETELILKSRRVIPGRLLEAGFTFRFPDWPEAVQDLISRWRAERS